MKHKSFQTYRHLLYLLLLAPVLWHQTTQATSLIGTSSIVWQNQPYVFRNGDIAQGYVRLNAGFTLNNTSFTEATMDTFITISGSIDLRGQMLQLLSDITLDSGTTLTSGGSIYGRGRTVVLQGNLSFTPTSTQVLHITNDTTIDGQGNILTLGDYAQIFVDSNATLTLRNIVIKSSPKSSVFPPIRLGSLNSKLALDRVWMPLSADFNFYQGRLFIYNDVSITGTSAFIYGSTQQSYITPGALLYFDNSTTLSYAPSTNAANAKDLLLMQDAKSMLFLNGCSLAATHTGFRLINGILACDNRVPTNSVADYDISAGTVATQVGSNASTQTNPTGVVWSPDGNFAAVTGSSGLQLFSVNGSTTPVLFGSAITTGGPTPVGTALTTNSAQSSDFYLTAVILSSGVLQLYTSSGTGSPVQLGSNVTTAGTPVAVAITTNSASSSNPYLIAVINSNGTLQLFSSSGVGTPVQIGSNVTTAATPTSVSITTNSASSTNPYLISVTNSNGALQLFTSSGTGTPEQVGVNVTTAGTPTSVSITTNSASNTSPYYIAVINSNSTLQLFTSSGSGTPVQVGTNVTTASTPTAVSITINAASSTNPYYIAVINSNSTLQLFTSSSTGTPIQIGSTVTTASTPSSVSITTNSANTTNAYYISVLNSNSTLQLFTSSSTGTPVQVGNNVTTATGTPVAVSITTNSASTTNAYYISLINSGSPNTLQMFTSSSSGTPVQVGNNVSLGASIAALAGVFSPDGRFIALTTGANALQIYAFNRATPAPLGSSVTTGTTPDSVAWSPDGRYLALINNGSNSLQVYSFNGTVAPTAVGSAVTTSAAPIAVAWSPDAKSIAVVNNTGNTLQVFTFNGTSTPAQVGSNATTATAPTAVAFSPDGQFIAVTNTTGPNLQVFSYNGTSTPTQVGSNATTSTTPNAVSWSPNGRFIAVTCGGTGFLQIFSFNGVTTPTQVGSNLTVGTTPDGVAWSPRGNMLAVVNNGSSTLQIFLISTIKTANAQALSNCIVFGNSALGSTADLNVQLLGGARIEVTGALYDNSI